MDIVLFSGIAFSMGLATNLFLRHVFKKQQKDSLVEGYISISKKAQEVIEAFKIDSCEIDEQTGRVLRKRAIEKIDRLIKKASDEDELTAVAIINPVDFHKVNEAYGYETGDVVILEMYNRIKAYLNDNKSTKGKAAVGVTESANFLIWMPIGMGERDIKDILLHIGAIIRESVKIEGKNITITANIGCVFVPVEMDVGEEVYLILEKITKRSHEPNRVCTVDDMRDDFPHKSAIIEEKISKALKDDGIHAYIQPIVNVDTKTIVAAEVLARMNLSDEIISPEVFIPVSEKTGLIDKIAISIVDKSIKTLVEMRNMGRLQEDFYLSINLTINQIGNQVFMDEIIKKAKDADVPHKHIQWEITESIFNDNETLLGAVNGLIDNGFKVALDDFGTGYSSLQQLSRLKVTGIKIDRSFITDIHNNQRNSKLVSAILGIGKSLGMNVIAEGVEKESELNVTKSMGLNTYQGFYFFKPMPLQHFLGLVKQP